MQMTFPRVVVEELRQEAGLYRTKNKALREALIKSECARLNMAVTQIPSEVLEKVEVTNTGEIIGIPDALAALETK